MALNPRVSKILNSIKNPEANIFSDSELNNVTMVKTEYPALNVAFSGKFNGGITSGVNIIAGESKNGKTLLSLIIVKAYLDRFEDAYCIFLDSEFGAKTLMDVVGIDQERVIHVPVTTVEQAKVQLNQMLQEVDRGDHYIVLFDSLGNIASNKELEDAINAKVVADMSRAKGLKSFFRTITPQFTALDIPFIGIQHTYKTQDLFPTDVVAGGTGSVYAANSIFIMGKVKEKDGTEIQGFTFKLRTYKSRFVREGSVFEFQANFDNGFNKYSDLFEFAVLKGYIDVPTKGFYSYNHEKFPELEEKRYRRKEIEWNDDFWKPILEREDFQREYEKTYALA